MRALIWDCDGVLADTERWGHLPAFNQMFAEVGAPIVWSEETYGRLLSVGGGKERLRSFLTPGTRRELGLPADVHDCERLITEWHRRKTEIYVSAVRSGKLPIRPGVSRLVREAAEAGCALAVASTSAEASVRAILERVQAEAGGVRFAEVVAGDVVAKKKPAPDVYLLTLETMGLRAHDAMVIEDSGNGVAAARGAGIECVVTVSSYTARDDFAGAAAVLSSLGDPGGEKVTVLRNESGVELSEWVTFEDLSHIAERNGAWQR